MLLQRALFRQADKLKRQGVREADRAAAAERMPRRQRQHQTILPEGVACQPAQIGVIRHDADIRRLFGNRLRDDRTGQLLQRDVGVRVQHQKIRQQLRQKSVGGDGIGDDAQLAALARRELGHVAPQPVALLQQHACVLQQAFTGRRRLDAARIARQQRHPGLLLQPAHACAGGGQRQPDALGAGGDAAGLEHRRQQSQIDKVKMHAFFLCLCRRQALPLPHCAAPRRRPQSGR